MLTILCEFLSNSCKMRCIKRARQAACKSATQERCLAGDREQNPIIYARDTPTMQKRKWIQAATSTCLCLTIIEASGATVMVSVEIQYNWISCKKKCRISYSLRKQIFLANISRRYFYTIDYLQALNALTLPGQARLKDKFAFVSQLKVSRSSPLWG